MSELHAKYVYKEGKFIFEFERWVEKIIPIYALFPQAISLVPVSIPMHDIEFKLGL